MDVLCDLGTGAVELADPEDLQRFAVRVVAPPSAVGGSADVERLAGVLDAAGAGRLGAAGDVAVSPGWLRAQAHGRVDADWEDGFAAMCAYAATKGWIDESDGSISAHVVWPSAGS